MKYEKSCGGICFKTVDGELQTLIIRHRYGGHWAFPKGHVEADEDEVQTALREIKEETGIAATIVPGYRHTTLYSPAKDVSKTVIYFVCRADGGDTQAQESEVSQAVFVPCEHAAQLLTFEEDKNMLEQAKSFWLNAGI